MLYTPEALLICIYSEEYGPFPVGLNKKAETDAKLDGSLGKAMKIYIYIYVFVAGIRIRSDPLIFGPPDPLLISLDPNPTCNYGFKRLFSS